MQRIAPLANTGRIRAPTPKSYVASPIAYLKSSMKRTASGSEANAIISSAISPGEPAWTNRAEAESSITSLSRSSSGTRPSTIRWASPCTIAARPHPGFPTRTALRWYRRHRASISASISFSRPRISGSSPCLAMCVSVLPISVPAERPSAGGLGPPAPLPSAPGRSHSATYSESSTSPSSGAKPTPAPSSAASISVIAARSLGSMANRAASSASVTFIVPPSSMKRPHDELLRRGS